MFSLNVIERNNVSVQGNGEKTLLFAHGYGCDQTMWRFITPAFRDEYKIVLFDHVGSGKSDLQAYSREKYSSLQGYASDIVEICDVLALPNVTLVGHSVSAMIAVLAAIESPASFSSIIMVCPSPRYINDGDYIGGFTPQDIESLLESLDSNYLGWSSATAPAIMGNSDRPELGEELTESFCRNNPDIAKHFAKVTFLGDNRADLPKLTVPSLVMQCAADIIAPAHIGEYVQQHTPQSTLAMMEATGHCPHLSAPEETITVMKRFLSRGA
jgi:sigma-B regulation protein RsbQ